MSDTISYVRAAASGFYKLFGVKTDWTLEYFRVFGAPGAEGTNHLAGSARSAVILNGRSVYYGALLYMCDLLGSFWLVILAQSVVAATAIYLTVGGILRGCGRVAGAGPLIVGVAVAAFTPLGYFTGYLMPDVFGGFALLATANLLFGLHHPSRFVTSFWTALLLFSLVVHSANPPIVLGMTVFAFIYSRFRKIEMRTPRFAAVGLCIVIALLAEAAFSQAVRQATGSAPVRPPFLAIRLIADGPGYNYLERHCSTESYIYCRVLRSSARSSDTLLWSNDSDTSLFRGLAPQDQRLAAAEQTRFALAVFRTYPLEVLGNAAANSIRQLTDLTLVEFNYPPAERTRFETTVPPRAMEEIRATQAYHETMPTRWIEITSSITALIALLIMIGAPSLIANSHRRELIRGFCITILAAVTLNAIVCGAISGPHGRYEMRLIWILPVIAGALALSLRRRQALNRHDAAIPDNRGQRLTL